MSISASGLVSCGGGIIQPPPTTITRGGMMGTRVVSNEDQGSSMGFKREKREGYYIIATKDE